MTALRSIDPEQFLAEHLAQASPDLMRELLCTFIQALWSADADAVSGEAYGTVTAKRTNIRKSYRHGDLDTRLGTIDVAIPKFRAGVHFPKWLRQRRRRAEAALTSVVATREAIVRLLGAVLAERTDDWAEGRRHLGLEALSKARLTLIATTEEEPAAAPIATLSG